MPTDLLLIAFAGLMAAAALSDAARYTIPNWLCAIIALVFPLAALSAGLGWTGFALHLAGGFAMLVAGFALFAPGWIGGGDAKLLAAGALWFSGMDLVAFVFHTAIAGGLLVLLLIGVRRCVPMFQLSPGWVARTPLASGAPVPYGIAIAAGALWTLPGSVLAAS